jgi:Protein  of unknown function (DUF3018)
MAKTATEPAGGSRAKLRAADLCPIQIWVPDMRSPAFRKEAERQSRLVERTGPGSDALEFMESIAALDDDEEFVGLT